MYNCILLYVNVWINITSLSLSMREVHASMYTFAGRRFFNYIFIYIKHIPIISYFQVYFVFIFLVLFFSVSDQVSTNLYFAFHSVLLWTIGVLLCLVWHRGGWCDTLYIWWWRWCCSTVDIVVVVVIVKTFWCMQQICVL